MKSKRRIGSWIVAALLVGVFASPAYASSDESMSAVDAEKDESSLDDESSGADDDADHDDDPQRVAVDPHTGEILGPAPDDWVERRWATDLNLDAGFARRDEQLGLFARGRAGVTRIEGSYAISLGATGEVGTESTTFFGLELDILSLHLGVFGHAGGGVDLDGNPVASVGGGWQIIGVEAQYRTTPDDPDNYGWTGIMKLRVPVSWLIRAARQ